MIGPECRAGLAVAAEPHDFYRALRAAHHVDHDFHEVRQAEVAPAALAVARGRGGAAGQAAAARAVALQGFRFEDQVPFEVAPFLLAGLGVQICWPSS